MNAKITSKLHSASVIRAWALIRKETKQMLRDKSTLTLGIILPILLLLLFGFGLSLDVKLVPVVVVRDNSSPVTRDLYTSLKLSSYFNPTMVNSWQEAEHMLRSGATDAIVRRKIKESSNGFEHIQIIVNGRDSNTACIRQRYLESVISRWSSIRQGEFSFLSSDAIRRNAGLATAETRIWYNSEQESRYFLIPGVTALIMTLIGTLLTALAIAREWERGTYEALVATPVKRWEIVAAGNGWACPIFNYSFYCVELVCYSFFWIVYTFILGFGYFQFCYYWNRVVRFGYDFDNATGYALFVYACYAYGSSIRFCYADYFYASDFSIYYAD